MGAAAAVILIKERDVIDAFKRAHATSPDNAKSADAVGVDPDRVGMRRLRERAVIREATPGNFYVDLEVWEALRRTRKRVLLALLLALILAGAAFGVTFR